MPLFNSISLATCRANGDVIDHQSFDGTTNACATIAQDIATFQEVWEPGEYYVIHVNGHEVDRVENI